MIVYHFKENLLPSGIPEVTVYRDGIQMGDPLTDLGMNDGYRYHDGLHVVLHAYTGWSPVLDSFEGKESTGGIQEFRKDTRVTFDDSKQTLSWIRPKPSYQLARTREEAAILMLTFNDAKRRNFYRDQKPSPAFVKLMQQVTEETSLNGTSKKEWSKILVDMYDVFANLVQHRGGYLDVDPEKKIVQFRPE